MKIEVLKPRAIAFAADLLLIPGENTIPPEKMYLLETEAAKKALARLSSPKLDANGRPIEGTATIRVLDDKSQGRVFDKSASPFDLDGQQAIKLIESEVDIATLKRWAADRRAKGALKQAIIDQLEIAQLEQKGGEA